mmetsp:Transcript_17248/g.39167  ORF Transcript_17248/g.39167 Transcript_17248/m.39167 type:complete len:88 (-) Transcript_17248:24-287(-)
MKYESSQEYCVENPGKFATAMQSSPHIHVQKTLTAKTEASIGPCHPWYLRRIADSSLITFQGKCRQSANWLVSKKRRCLLLEKVRDF